MHSAFLIQNDWMPRSVCDASRIAWRHASSKLVGDWAITSMLRTIDIVVSSSGGPWPQLPPAVPIPCGLWRLSAESGAMRAVIHRADGLGPLHAATTRPEQISERPELNCDPKWPIVASTARARKSPDASTPYNGA